MNRIMTLINLAETTPRLVITRLSGSEALSTLGHYCIQAETVSREEENDDNGDEIELKSLIGQSVSLRIALEAELQPSSSDPPVRWINGIIEKARYLGHDAQHAHYELMIRPWLFLLTKTVDFKIYQQKSVVDILHDVLKDYGRPYEIRLEEAYPSLDYQVQYGESDFDFLQRLMEKWGIYWFVEHAENSHKIIFVESPQAHPPFEHDGYQTLPYLAQSPDYQAPYIHTFHYQEALTTGHWVTSDYDFTVSRKTLSVTEQQPRKTHLNRMEIYDWPGNFTDNDVGERLAKVRIESLGAQGHRCSGIADLRGMLCGSHFTLSNYPLGKANRSYFILSTELEIINNRQSSTEVICQTRCHFTVQPLTKRYRHPQNTPKPRTFGPQTARVTGPAEKEIWTDQFGRVKVRFQWDRYGQNSEADSCWLRVSQAWAGNRFGGMYIPRVGHEVIVDFIQGDPDRPLIMGSLYNDKSTPPWALPNNGSQSGLVSRSVGGSEANFNGIRFEDRLGQEQYWEQAERDMHRLTKQNEVQVIGASQQVEVGQNYSSTVAGTSNYVVGASVGVTVGGAHHTTVGGLMSMNAGAAIGINAGGAIGIASGGAMSMVTGGAMGLAVGGAMGLSSGGELVISASRIRIIADSQIILQAGQIDFNPGDAGPRGGGGGGGIIGLPGIKPTAGLFVGKRLSPLPTPTVTSSTNPEV
ncbi:type VI secretion system Vgr family protein [Rosenbergiella nectarea]|uniref:type VI secretion system Vgr family protein n=1 Tax=Rosenbergiella nectarea TaxID=988801 RepID=UPI001BD9E51C|nr:type VI secretion system tip protein TssI/VgrG [Rosenbergiella nectarea]MBT0729780.1 type VI secretion system tip protein VgrG [Rosenbergiella nectarea subsp. apis]